MGPYSFLAIIEYAPHAVVNSNNKGNLHVIIIINFVKDRSYRRLGLYVSIWVIILTVLYVAIRLYSLTLLNLRA